MSSIPHLTFVAVTLITIMAVTGLEMDTMPDIVYLSYEQDFGMKSGR